MHTDTTKFDFAVDLVGIVATIFVVFGTIFLIWYTSPKWFNINQKELANAPAGVLGVKDSGSNANTLHVEPVKIVSNFVDDKSFDNSNGIYTYSIKFSSLYAGDYTWKILNVKSHSAYVVAVKTMPSELPLKFEITKANKKVVRYPAKQQGFAVSKQSELLYINFHAKQDINYPFTVEVRIFKK